MMASLLTGYFWKQHQIAKVESVKPEVRAKYLLYTTTIAPEVKPVEAKSTEQVRMSPVKLEIPKIQLTAAIDSLGLNTNGAQDVPTERGRTSWFKYGPNPGEIGSAVLAGHYKWTYGQGIFYRLPEISIGDEIFVTDTNNKVVKFKVSDRKIYDKNNFPIKEVYAKNDKKRLNLITCYGNYSLTSQDYDKRLVVYSETE